MRPFTLLEDNDNAGNRSKKGRAAKSAGRMAVFGDPQALARLERHGLRCLGGGGEANATSRACLAGGQEGDTPGIHQALGPHSQGVARGLYHQIGFGLQASLRASLQGQGRLVQGRRQGSKVKAQHLGEGADHVAAPRRWQLQEIINSSKNRSRAQAVAFASTQPACGFAKELNLRSCGVGLPMGKLTILRHREQQQIRVHLLPPSRRAISPRILIRAAAVWDPQQKFNSFREAFEQP